MKRSRTLFGCCTEELRQKTAPKNDETAEHEQKEASGLESERD